MKQDNVFKMYFDLTMEILQGCRHDCMGCAIDRDNIQYPTDNEWVRLEQLLDSFVENDQILYHLNIGATDVISANNREQLFNDPHFKRIAPRFIKHSFTCSFLSPRHEDYVALARDIESVIPNGVMRFQIPFEAKHIDNPKYIETISKHMKWLKDEFTTVDFPKVLCAIIFDSENTYSYEEKEKLSKQFVNHAKSLKLLDGIEVEMDFNFPHARRSLDDIMNAHKFVRSVKYLNNTMVSLMDDIAAAGGECPYDWRVRDYLSNEGLSWDTLYLNGELYLRPFLLESVTAIDDVFKINGEWSYSSFYHDRQEKLVKQYTYAHTVPDCVGCEFMSLCSHRGVHAVMERLGLTECFSPLKLSSDEFKWM